MTAPVPDNPIVVGLAILAAGRSDEELLDLLTPQGRQAVIVAALTAHAEKINQLEETVAAADDKIAELSTVLTNIQGDVGRLATDLQAARDEIAAQDPLLAAKLDPVLEQARAIDAATPEPQPEA